MTDLDVVALRNAFDSQLRPEAPDPVPAGVTVERDGPLVRVRGMFGRGFLTYRDLDGLRGDELTALIERQRDHFRQLGEPVEWKHYAHDEPADLPDRLRAAGFAPEDEETVVVGPVASLAATMPVVPDGVRLREVTARADLDRIAAMEEEVWQADRSHHAGMLESELAAAPDGLTVVVAEETDGGRVVSAGWIRYERGSSFASLWGGATLAQWRGRGIYRALVVHRARLADARGYAFLQVDASDDSRPILQRLGLVAITTTTPYVYTP
ncbi:GNAT family N-acetyltransferase [Plantactinospora sp. GCM10030261]|uniref:GNAT family N-acetyltransferase n=1 Tax=Plantactinospora sp. GCM10030261 TaxID=3273420 RepID=UPI0036137D5E